MTPPSVVLAHGGGAPETAMIGLPLVLLAAFGVLELRARKREAAAAASADADSRQQLDDRTDPPGGTA